MARFILVHGAWHGGWCWEDVAPLLRDRGHHVLTPDLPGMGADARSDYVATLDEWAMFIAGMAAADTEPAILVGHSRGGIVVSRAAEFAPQGSVSRLVYCAAAMATPGQSMAELFAMASPEQRSPHIDGAVAFSEDGRTAIWHDQVKAVSAFYNTTPEAKARAAFDRLTPEPCSMRDAPVTLSQERYGAIPRLYIQCERDQAVMPSLQQIMIAAQPCATASLETDHSPFYSAPIELAALLDRAANDPGAG